MITLSKLELETGKPLKLPAVASRLRSMASRCPSLFSGLDPSAPAKTLIPLIARMEREGLIAFEDGSPSYGDLAKRHPAVLINLMEQALADRLDAAPGWTWTPTAEATVDPSTLEWGAPPKEKVVGDSPDEEDPRFGTW